MSPIGSFIWMLGPYLDGGTVWEGLGEAALSEEMCHWGWALKGFNSPWQAQSSLFPSLSPPHLQIMNQNVRKTARAIHLTHLLSLPMFNTSRMENMSWLRISSQCIHVLPDQAKVLNVTTSPFTTQLHYHVSQAPVSPRNSSWYPRQLPCHPRP